MSINIRLLIIYIPFIAFANLVCWKTFLCLCVSFFYKVNIQKRDGFACVFLGSFV